MAGKFRCFAVPRHCIAGSHRTFHRCTVRLRSELQNRQHEGHGCRGLLHTLRKIHRHPGLGLDCPTMPSQDCIRPIGLSGDALHSTAELKGFRAESQLHAFLTDLRARGPKLVPFLEWAWLTPRVWRRTLDLVARVNRFAIVSVSIFVPFVLSCAWH